MHTMRVGRVLLLGLVGVVVGCSSKPQEEMAVASSASPLVVEGWEGTGAMAEARKLHAGVALQSGKVLVVGGSRGSVYLTSATVYEPGTGSWTVVAPMAEARESPTATLLPSGKVLVAGGVNGTGRLASTTVYDPATNTWASAGTFASGVARDSMTATLLPLPLGKVLVAGGGNSGGAQSKVDVYDPVAGTWSLGASMLTPRRSHTATLLPSGKVLVVGGTGSGSLATAELYDPVSNKWTVTGGMATARYNHTATLLASGKVLVVGGRKSSTEVVGTAEVYDPSSGTWSVTSALGSGREFHTATLLSTGKVLVAGGQNGSALGSALLYDEGSGTWSATGAMGAARYQHVAVVLEAQKKVLVVGGVGSASQATAEVYAYDACAGVSCTSAPGTCYEAAGTCSNGVCSYAPKASGASCDDGNACTGADACNGAGVCAGSATHCSSPPGQCYEAAGTCSGGACDYAYKAAGASCDDGDACTVGEECNGAGGCAGTPVSCTTPPGQCYEAAGTCSGGACGYAPKAAGSACNDGNAGTLNDVCNGAGACAGVVACTTPPNACHDSPGTYANGACTYPLKAGGTGTPCGAGQICDAAGQCQSGCWIAGAYYAAGATNPSGDCQQCNPSVSTNSWSFKPAGTECRASGGECDVAESCTGSTATCPADVRKPGTTVCRASAGLCDVAESCTGSSNTCPADGFVARGTQCRASAGVCDVAESCTGTAAACPADAVVSAGTVCRTSSGSCDVAESCNGSSKACPVDGYAPNGTTCASSYEEWGSCQRRNPYDSCSTDGTQSLYAISFTCVAGTCSSSSTNTGTQTACTVEQPDCGGVTSVGPWSECTYSDIICSETGTRQRDVTGSYYNCSRRQCEQVTWTESVTSADCTRDTEGFGCGSFPNCNSTCYGDVSSTCPQGGGFQLCSDVMLECKSGSCSLGSMGSTYTKCCRN